MNYLNEIEREMVRARPQNERVKVTRIGPRWHCRLFIDGVLHMEMAVDRREGIQWCCREMLRQADKGGFVSARTSASRLRYNGKRRSEKVGRVWWVVSMPGDPPVRIGRARR